MATLCLSAQLLDATHALNPAPTRRSRRTRHRRRDAGVATGLTPTRPSPGQSAPLSDIPGSAMPPTALRCPSPGTHGDCGVGSVKSRSPERNNSLASFKKAQINAPIPELYDQDGSVVAQPREPGSKANRNALGNLNFLTIIHSVIATVNHQVSGSCPSRGALSDASEHHSDQPAFG